MTNLWVGLAY